ncbi:MAG: hypothetical protein HYY65_14570 [Candidatus Tectomicrobia bacterium]|uniref:Uncharacterized protein n=1 Tax=Tectimicrobiota bacterium TaxID=2528274 RepID=A0A932GSL1_UNCTE|nr:hypothetical protein [Candidatus Tectomicrobia bacterium]
MAETNEQETGTVQDLKAVEADAIAKFQRHRVDDYVAILLGVGSALILWLFQLMGFY